MSLRKLDLNLLTVFDAIYSEGNLTRAASDIGMSQPAMSNALNRLRHITKDDLFVRDGRGIHPTPVATEIAPIIRQALNLLEMGLETTPGLKAGHLQGFTIAGLDYYEVIVLPKLLATIEDRAPGTTVKAVTGASEDFEKPLRLGDVDILIDYVPIADPEFRCEVLFLETRVVLANKNVDATRTSISLEEFALSGHVARAERDGDSRLDDIDTMLGKSFKRRSFQVTVNNWLALPAVISRSNLIGVVPLRIAELYANTFNLQILPLPMEVRPTPFYMIWHQSRDSHHGHRWLRAQLKRVCRTI